MADHGRGKNQLPIEKAKLAMAVRGKSAHYRINEIQARHWKILAESTAIRDIWERMRTLVESTDSAFGRLEQTLPREFPERVFTTIRDGVRSQADRGFGLTGTINQATLRKLGREWRSYKRRCKIS